MNRSARSEHGEQEREVAAIMELMNFEPLAMLLWMKGNPNRKQEVILAAAIKAGIVRAPE